MQTFLQQPSKNPSPKNHRNRVSLWIDAKKLQHIWRTLYVMTNDSYFEFGVYHVQICIISSVHSLLLRMKVCEKQKHAVYFFHLEIITQCSFSCDQLIYICFVLSKIPGFDNIVGFNHCRVGLINAIQLHWSLCHISKCVGTLMRKKNSKIALTAANSDIWHAVYFYVSNPWQAANYRYFAWCVQHGSPSDKQLA